MAFARDSGFPRIQAGGLAQLVDGQPASAAEFNENYSDAQRSATVGLLPGVLSGHGDLTDDDLDVVFPDAYAYIAETIWRADGAVSVAVPDDATTYLWGGSDGTIRLTATTAPPNGAHDQNALLVKAVATGGVLNLDETVAHLARVSDAEARTVAEGGALSLDYSAPSATVIGRLHFQAGLRGSISAQTMSGNISLLSTGAVFWSLDPNGSDREVSLWASPATGDTAVVIHRGGANSITVKNSGGSTISTLSAGQTARAIYDGTAWRLW